jgi:hypothetical protein
MKDEILKDQREKNAKYRELDEHSPYANDHGIQRI